ncbi:ABC transporter ATP-binding protein [Desmospora profundinema]|uniref:Peptide/nickel transport system ATP-binding protein n=1 Tax=Desmospora profundinema TaxID=1571184 RepID=A0ABU1ILD4_9BACL|nr:ABC transporter ATP-binding protein [Desmospora profundinema]MDR6225590.1 peptide/nickel transport system ATP-binding protein [Desmospora profundinema]
MLQSHPRDLLEVENLSAGFTIDNQFYHAIRDVSLKVKKREVVGVVGESGCGKSVMSLSIMKLLPKENACIVSGEIYLNGLDLTKKTDKQMDEIRGKNISMIFQEPMTALNPVFSIGFQLTEVLFNHLTISKREANERAVALLQQVGISRPDKVLKEYPHQLSGGMRQRVMIAMAIANHPQLLIADEPTTALDVTIQAQILELLTEIQDQKEMAILLITHDLGVVAELCDYVLVMYAGEIIEKTDVERLFYAPKHPYTEALLGSIPKLEQTRHTLDSIPGVVPPLTKLSDIGCRFADRCPKATTDCQCVKPELKENEPGHDVRCLLYDTSYPNKTRVNT